MPSSGSFSCILSATILYTCSTSSSDNSDGTNGLNFSNDILEEFLAAVPDAPPCVIIVRNSKLLYLSNDFVLLAISEKSSSLPSLAPITNNTSSFGCSLA